MSYRVPNPKTLGRSDGKSNPLPAGRDTGYPGTGYPGYPGKSATTQLDRAQHEMRVLKTPLKWFQKYPGTFRVFPTGLVMLESRNPAQWPTGYPGSQG
eukprot:974395-Rhodomonas_salina.1